MTPLRINIILPFPATKPGGGVKIMYEYANRLQQKGHTVTVLHSIRRPYKKMRSPLWWKKFIYSVRKAERPKWFPLHEGIDARIVSEITDAYVPDGDIVLSTWWEMTYMISGLSEKKGKPFNLIQDLETWKGNSDLVYASYKLPVNHLVISKWLQKLVMEHSGNMPVHIPNAIDTKKFALLVPVEERKNKSIIMLYSEEQRKGSAFGIEALVELKKEIPGLSVTLFGVFPKPLLPSWIRYEQKPMNLPELYNEHAIFFSPSLGEGWALPPAEAMACGCAVVCTDIGGHHDYAKDEETALLVQPKNVEEMVICLWSLISNEETRISIAKKGNEFICSNFSWEASVGKLEQCFYGSVS